MDAARWLRRLRANGNTLHGREKYWHRRAESQRSFPDYKHASGSKPALIYGDADQPAAGFDRSAHDGLVFKIHDK